MYRTQFASFHTYQHLRPEQVADPYQTARSWFTQWLYIDIKYNLQWWFETSLGKEIWPQGDASYLLEFYDTFIMAIEGAHLMNELFNLDRAAVLKTKKSETEIFQSPHLFCENGSQHDPFTYFPRSLTLEEFHNPYTVFTHFFTLHDLKAWKMLLYILMNMSLTEELPTHSIDNYNLLVCRLQLDKLADAMHLIYVREYPRPAEALARTAGIRKPGMTQYKPKAAD